MGFPAALTEEEEMLKKKYALLRKKKKQLVQLKQNKRQGSTSTVSTQKKRAAKEEVSEGAKEAAKEVAKKLVATGAIRLDADSKSSGFKRSKNLEHKLKDPEKSHSMLTFQPFHPSTPTGDETSPSPAKSFKPLSESFVTSGSLSRGDSRPGGHYDDRREKRKGNTVYVHGHGITEKTCQQAFSHIGRIVQINMERDKHCGFVTFEKMEMADKAIEEMNGSSIAGIHLRVSMARRQPMLESATDNSPWGSVAAGITKNSHREKREMVVYDDDDVF
ncbi:negative elongation factor E-like [Glandiceps talaboti]